MVFRQVPEQSVLFYPKFSKPACKALSGKEYWQNQAVRAAESYNSDDSDSFVNLPESVCKDALLDWTTAVLLKFSSE